MTLTASADPPPPGSTAAVDAPVRRVVVVRDGRLADRVAAACPRTCAVDRIPGFLGGLAELLAGSADRLVGPAETLAGMSEAMARTLQEAGLSDRVVLVEADPAARATLSAAGFGCVLGQAADAASFSDALGVTRGFAEAGRATVDAPTGEGPPGAAGASVPPPVEAVGDSDLVEAIHDAGGGADDRLPALLSRVLTASSGLPGVRLTPEADPGGVPEGHASSRVCFRGDCFGRLHAPPPSTPDTLAPWAGWAARWLALHKQTRQLRELAMRDELTGVWNRRYFNRFLTRILERAANDRQQVTLMVFDIDDFKSFNDLHGHAAGDAILTGAAQLMQSTVRAHDVVARIGGDEFAVIFWDPRGRREEGSEHPESVLAIARRFQKAVTDLRFPQLAAEAPGRLTVSGGIAGFPWDGRTPEDLLRKADLMAMESKAQGKNAITIGAALPPASAVPPAAG